MTIWSTIIYSDTLHRSDITPSRDLVTEVILGTKLDRFTELERFSWNICGGCGITVVIVDTNLSPFFLINGFLLVRRDESPENYCHSPGVVVVVVVVVVHRQKL